MARIVEHQLVRHAAHYLHGAGGHDLEQWVIEAPARPVDVVALGLPQDASYHSGFVRDGVQFWTFTAIRPLSEGTCARCAS